MLNPATMPFKVNRPGLAFTRLEGYSVLEAKGLGAEAFLQAQLMNDVAALADGHWQWNGWLTPKGRVIALLALVRLSPDAYLLVLPDADAETFRLALQRYVMRAKVVLTVRNDLACAADFDDAAAIAFMAADGFAGDPMDGIALDWSGAGGRRSLLILPAASPVLALADSATDARWLAADLAHGLPRLPESQREAWTPQMLSLDRLHAFSLKKGCYPGQEIVARTHYLGKAKRHLSTVASEALSVGAELHDLDGKPAGTVIAVTASGETGLAVLSSDAGQLRDGPRPVLASEPLGGLQRPV